MYSLLASSSTDWNCRPFLQVISRIDASNSGEAWLENFSRSAAMVRARRYNFSSAFAFSERMALRSCSGIGRPSTSATVGSMGP